MKYTIQELYRGNIEVYDNYIELIWEIEKCVQQQIPITISYNDTMTQPKKSIVSKEKHRVARII